MWYRLLNLGFRLPAGAGTDAMANYASLRGPVGMNRVFLDTGGKHDAAGAAAALKAGHGFVSNGPLLGLAVDGRKPGDAHARLTVRPSFVSLRSPVAVDHLELVHNGKVKPSSSTGERRHFDAEGEIDSAPAAGCCCAPGTTAPIRRSRPVSLRHHQSGRFELPDGAPGCARRRRLLRRLARPRDRSRRSA